MQFFTSFRQTPEIGILDEVQKPKGVIWKSSMLSREINAVFKLNNYGIDIEKDKSSKIFLFSPYLVNFCQTR